MSPQRSDANVVISPNHPVFDLPEIVALEHGMFAAAGLDVRFAERAGPEDRTERDPAARRKESLFEHAQADVYNLCEWGGIDRLERNRRPGRLGYLRPAIVAQALVSFDPALQEPHDLSGIPVGVNEFTGSHYTALHLLEGAVARENVVVEHVGFPEVRLQRAESGAVRAVMLMEPYLSLARKRGAHLLGTYFYRGVEVIAPELSDTARETFVGVVDAAVDLINADPARYRHHLVAEVAGELDESELGTEHFRYTRATPVTERRFTESYAWMRSWRLTSGAHGYRTLLGLR
ncbi:nitrate ABC transporter substrate-binding protein [Saccharopolyspora sp. NPDC047091]|uniref:nitrate ABC transporter substrate-binding protein n=1 Tax=Saccharopolyspora sp. NPDC047091 TaxID=3155924 RepID=UPI0033D8FB82